MGVIIFVTKSNVFIVKKVAVTGNPIITGEDVKERCEKVLGENIFFVSKSDLTKEAKKNPYVEAVTVTKKFPKQININIVEKEGIYYLDEGKNKLILSNRLVLLERTDDLRGRNLVEIKGIEYKEGEVGERVLDDNRISEILTTFYNIVRNNPTEYNISSIDLHDLTNIKVYIGEVEGRLGNDENLLDKMNKILHIVSSQEVVMNKGYIDVSFEGSPVYHHE
ncbi:FtsQ-type POTRA domain-containing protein [Clostridium botulinum]|uniref:cell division protein FtsQ/DivIB n=1 Tax=Clostridium sp. M14 TaxID=2716311 RepID=UPI0013CAA256|nr:FtsQ-type POTRA domain-containing protein [Clostridium sp. M14]MBZ9692107.1 FtsQ-type POTRA domain-containing protein [Clostridium sp. M14]NFG41839.1 FtsQ-type POTRA domain-containing protein [Clostridium botulinum]NFI94610.1 FtsQ-type POTRA domain-containing protein [Clostridium botulinum]NFO91779.1 FtsQ-type POTRA domain-containing protein [Clostridium botulinum]